MASWWQAFPVTQSFGQSGEQGVDIGTPFHTPLSIPFGGTVTAAGYHDWGGQVDIATAIPGQPGIRDESVLHLDQITVSPGEVIPAGTVIGYSGGQNVGGAHPAAPQYSSGPHTEIDFFGGRPFNSSAFNPLPILAGVSSPAGTGGLPGVGDIAGIPTAIGHGIADAIGAGVTDVGVFFRRQAVALFVAAVVLFVLFAGTGDR